MAEASLWTPPPTYLGVLELPIILSALAPLRRKGFDTCR
jgi:hypothetical protein